jgi:hypothetical protein
VQVLDVPRNVQVISTAGPVSIDPITGTEQVLQLSANVTNTSIVNDALAGTILSITYSQDAIGGRTYIWPVTCRFSGTPPNNTTASTDTSVMFRFDGLYWREISRVVGVSQLPRQSGIRFSNINTSVYTTQTNFGAALASGLDVRGVFTWDVPPSASAGIIGMRATGTGNTCFWLYQVMGTPELAYQLFPGTDTASVTSILAPGLFGNPAQGAWIAIRFTYNASNGQSTWYWDSTGAGTTWTQVQQTTTTIFTPFASTLPLRVHGLGGIVSNSSVSWMELWSFAGTRLARADFTVPRFPLPTDPVGNTWNLTGSAYQWVDATVPQP